MIKYFIIILVFYSCCETDKKGRKYFVDQKCLKSHTEIRSQMMVIGKMCYPSTIIVNVCDSFMLDTIYLKK